MSHLHFPYFLLGPPYQLKIVTNSIAILQPSHHDHIYPNTPPTLGGSECKCSPSNAFLSAATDKKYICIFRTGINFVINRSSRVPICEWRPKFQLLPLGRAIHNGATFSMFSNEFSRWKSSAGANTVAQSSSCFTSYNWPAIQERRLFPSQKNWVCPFGKTRFIPGGKTGFNRQQMGINAGKAGSSSIFAALLTFSKIFGPKSFSCGS